MNLFIESDNWSDFSLSSNEWKLIEYVASLLKLNEKLVSFIIKNQSNKAAVEFTKELKFNLRSRFPSHGSENKLRRVANYLAPWYKGIHLHETHRTEEIQIAA